MIEILRKNNFETPEVPVSEVFVGNKRSKQTERRILKGFNISSVDNVLHEAFANQEDGKSKEFFKVIAKAIGNKKKLHSDKGSIRCILYFHVSVDFVFVINFFYCCQFIF